MLIHCGVLERLAAIGGNDARPEDSDDEVTFMLIANLLLLICLKKHIHVTRGYNAIKHRY